jgi:hypothetical protein
VGSFIICTLHQISSRDKIKENEVGGACGKHGRREKGVEGFGSKARREGDGQEDQGVDGRMVTKWILRG